jgi:phosphopantothenoylcysteine decarboxylase/phosphopantothenate--cysteine ligase
MNVNMWENAATRANLEKLKARGVCVVEPDAGYLACGMTGPGRLAANETIVAATLEALGAQQDLSGETVLITAGPTREKIDPVRYLGNRSSGRMGYALAEAALRRGARVILVSGPVAIKAPAVQELVAVETTEEMRREVLARMEQATVIIKAAAVADFTFKTHADQKLKRKGPMTLELEPTADILAEIGRNKKEGQIVAGFAAETENILENARRKLKEKHCDMVVVNDVSQPGIGFDSERNAVSIITQDEVEDVPEMSKWEVAHRVLDAVVHLRLHKKNKDVPVNAS